MMKALRLTAVIWVALAGLAMGAYDYVWIDTNTGVYKPARAEADQHSNVQATTGRFDVLWVAGVQITGSSTGTTPVADDPISGVESDGQVPGYISLRDIPTRYSGASFWYPFDYDSSVILDTSDSGNHAVNRRAAVPMTWSDYCLDSSRIGENYLVQINSNGVLNLSAYASIGSWIWFDSEVTNNNVLLSAGGVSNRTAIWMDATNVYAIISGSSTSSVLSYAYGADLVTGTWHRIVATYEKKGGTGTSTAEHKMWLDSVLVASTSAAPNFFVSNVNRFMVLNTDGTPAQNAFVDGSIDDPFAVKSVWSGLDVTNDWTDGRSYGKNEFATAKPATPSYVSPVNGATVSWKLNQTLAWEASSVASSYHWRYGFTSGSQPSNGITTTNAYVDIGQTGNGSNYYWYVIASNSYGASTGSLSTFYAYSYSYDFYTNVASYYLFTVQAVPTNLTAAYDYSPIDGLTNWIFESESSGTIPYWTNFCFAFDSAGGNKPRIKSSNIALTYAGTNGAFNIGMWIKPRDKYAVGGPNFYNGQGLFGGGESSSVGSSLYLYNPYAGTPWLYYTLKFFNYTKGTYTNLFLRCQLSTPDDWTFVQVSVDKFADSPSRGYQVSIYQNGVITAIQSDYYSSDVYTFPQTAELISVGRLSDYADAVWSYYGITHFDGWIDDFYISKVKPTVSQYSSLYSRQRSGY